MALAADWATLATVVVCWLEVLELLEQLQPLRVLELLKMVELLALWTTTVCWRLPENGGLLVERATRQRLRLLHMRDSADAHVRNVCVLRLENSSLLPLVTMHLMTMVLHFLRRRMMDQVQVRL